jgi:hypothetical protein
MDAGDYCAAERYEKKIEALLEVAGWSPGRIAQLEADGFFSYVQQVPAYLGMFCFFRGLLNLNHRHDLSAARHSFENAGHLFQLELDTQIYPRGGWRERSQYYLALARMGEGHTHEALQLLDRLVANPETVPEDLWKGILLCKGRAHLKLGHMLRASRCLVLSACQPPMRGRDHVVCKLGTLLLGGRSRLHSPV